MILAPALLLFALADCESVEVTGDAFYDVCGSDIDLLRAYTRRIAQAGTSIETLRQIHCDVEAESDPVRAVVQRDLEYAVTNMANSEANVLRLVEAGLVPFFTRPDLPHASERTTLRLERVANDPQASESSRCWAITLLQSIRGTGAIRQWINESCAAEMIATELRDDERREVLAHRDHPLYLEVLFQERPDGPRIDLLCALASDRNAPVNARERAIDRLGTTEEPEAAACLVALLQPETWFVIGAQHSVPLVIDALAIIDSTRARKLASAIDTSRISDVDVRMQVDDALFDLRAYDPRLPSYEPY